MDDERIKKEIKSLAAEAFWWSRRLIEAQKRERERVEVWLTSKSKNS